jgi:hypothetical protein
MKKQFCFWKLLAAALVMPALIPACDNGLTDDTDKSGIDIIDRRYETVPYKSAAESGKGYELIYSSYDDTGNYYLFLLGKVKYVPVACGPYFEYNGTTPQQIRYEKSLFEQTTIIESIKTAASHSFTNGTSTELKLSAKEGFGIGPFEASIEGSVSQKWYTDETESRSFTSTYTTETVKGFKEKIELTATVGEHGEAAGLYRYAFFTITDVYYVVKTDKAKTTVTEAYIALCNRPGGGWYLDYAPGYDDTFGKTAPGDLLKTPAIVPAELPVPSIKIVPPLDKWTQTRSEDGKSDITGIADAPVKETFQPNLPVASLQQLGCTKVTINVDFRYKADIFFTLVPVQLRLQIADALGTTIFGQKDLGHYPDWTGNSLAVTVPIGSLNSDTGEFTLLWNRVGSGFTHTPFSVGRRTVSITASK